MTRALRFAIEHYLALPFGVLIALIWANAQAESYFRFAHDLSFVVNEVGMAFFLAVMTKEVVEATAHGGALHSWRRRALPVVAAVGGMIGAALGYQAWLQTGDELSVLASGWPIPCAIDLAFSYFVVKAIFRRHSAVPFILILAIATDALGLLIAALRYPVADVHGSGAALMGAAILVAIALRQYHVKDFWPYLLISGGLSWAAFFWGGLHPAFALVPVVPFLPHAPRDPGFLVQPPPDAHDTLNQFERAWKYPVHVVILSFGVVNAGVVLHGFGTGTWAVLVGALVGKPIGILVAVCGGVAAGLHLPRRLDWRDLVVVAFAASIGFTFALLVTTQAFPPGPLLTEAKIGALLTIGGALLAVTLAAMLGVGRFEDG